MRKLGAMLLSAVLLCTALVGNFSASAVDVHPMWDYLTLVGGNIEITSDGTATVTADSRASSSNVTKTSLTASLQQLKNGSWQEVKSWNTTVNSYYAKLPGKTWAVAHGYSYRVVVTAKVYQGSTLLESALYTKDYGYFR